jgi:hypothetical protein
MTYKLLTVFLLLVAQSAFAKEPIKLCDSTEQAAGIALTNNASLPTTSKPAMLFAMPRGYQKNGGFGTHFFISAELAYTSVTGKTDSTNVKGHGFLYRVDLGAKIGLPARSINTAAILSLSLNYCIYSIKPQSVHRHFTLIGLPVSYTRLRHGNDPETGGFYWTLGANFNYINSVKDDNDKSFNGEYNKIYIEPSISAGFCLPFELRRDGQTIGHGKYMIGPFFSDVVSNMSSVSGVTVNGWTLGLRYSYIFM